MPESLEHLDLGGGRFSDAKSPESPGPAASSLPPQQLRRALGGKYVCPFCGTQRDTDIGSCPNCSLEDSPTTRSATRSKLGPWYVLQSRNPSAPGMNFATLMVLVQKGRVTARSIVRGPTTGQFWRHAARAKGVSREFGLCWSCGGDVSKTARACPACKRGQEPPTDPDVLLEIGAEVNDEELAEAMWADHVPGGSPAPAPVSRTAPVADRAPADRSVPRVDRSAPVEPRPSPVDRLVARGGVRREVAAPTNGNGQGARVPAAAAERATLNRGVADALPASNLDMAVFQRPRSGGVGGVTRKVFKSLFVAVLILCSGLVAMASFDPGMRDRLIGWTVKGKTWAASAVDSIRNAKPIAQPDGATTAGELARADDGSAAAAAGSPQTPEQAKLRMWELWRAGVDAEKRGDFTAAVKAWSGITELKVPQEELPLGFEARLATAKKRVK